MSEQREREPMTREKSFDWKLDGAGLAAFGAGAFLSVLAVLALTREAPELDPLSLGGTTTLAALWTSTLGAVPCLLFGAVLTVLGARTFLLGDSRGTLKGVGVGAGVAFGLAIVLGSLGLAAAWADGGIAGETLGGTLARRAHPVAGVLLGIVVLGAVAWFATLRERVLAREAREATDVPVREITPRAPKGAKGAAKGAASPMAAAESAEGVTAEEAAALVPDEGHRRKALAAALALAGERGELRRSEVEEAPPPLPYPEDVRLKGQIPEGARPLGEAQRAYAAPAPVQSSGVVRWTPGRRDDADVFADDAGDAFATAVAEPEEELDVAPREHAIARPVPAPVADDADVDDEALEEDEEPLALDLDDEEEDEPEAVLVAQPEVEPEVEAVNVAPPRPSWEQTSLFEEDEEPAVDAYGTPVALVETLVGEDEEEAVAAELDEDLDEEDVEAAELEDGDEEDEEYEEEDEEDAEAAELEDGDEEDEEDEEEDEEDAEAAELEDGEEEDEEDAELEEVEPVAEADDAVLVPQPTPASEHAKRAGIVDPSKQRLYEAGCLFLDRGRVAVSMLQREYALEFDDACTMLDELQELGLIGPYLGGKHRDILLTSDEWLERVSAS